MLKNNLLLALRHFRKHKFYGIVNLSGLAIGLAACWLMMLFVKYEFGFDRFFDKADRIYQVNLAGKIGEVEFQTSNSPPTVGAAMLAELPQVQTFVRLHNLMDRVVKTEGSGQAFTEGGIVAVDSNFLDVFSFQMLAGDRSTCLLDPNAIVLTEPLARKYFGDQPPLGKILLMDDQPHVVTGVLAELPRQSSLQFNFLASMKAAKGVERFGWSWVWLQVDTYVLLKQKTGEPELAAMNARMPDVFKKHGEAAFRRVGQPLDEFFKSGGKWDFWLKPLPKVHLYSAGVGSRIGNLGNIEDTYVFGMVGLFVLLLACVNFMNLSTARSLGRAKEVGVRKVLGSERRSLMRQFLTESLAYGVVAGLLAATLAQLSLPLFNRLTGEALTFGSLFSGWTGWVALSLPVLAGLLAGTYPAFYLSAFRPIGALKANAQTRGEGGNPLLRKGLVVFQFTVGVALVICTLIVTQQVSFLKNKPLGFEKENVLLIHNAQRLGERLEVYRQQLLSQGQILGASHGTGAPAGDTFGDTYLPSNEDGNAAVVQDIQIASFQVDDDYVPTLGMELAAGRNFSLEKFPADTFGVIVNEAAVKRIGWKNPLGQTLDYPGGNNERFRVIGVMKDFNLMSPRNAIEPFALFHEVSKSYQLPTSLLAIRLRPGQEKTALAEAEKLWKATAAGAPFDFAFLDENFDAQYRSEEKLEAVLKGFSALSIFIACLGLFGLIAFAAERRTKEIGIRKVLGASTAGIVGLLSKDFLKLVVVALVIASPLAYFFMEKWLQDFAYRIDIQWSVFALAGIVAVAVAFLTVSFQSVKAALANPVKSLRSE